MPDFSAFDFAPVMNYPSQMEIFDLSKGYDPAFIRSHHWGIGKYNEKRADMYTTPQYADGRNIHMGIDIWAQAGQPVCAFYKGQILYLQDRAQPGDYGPTVVTVHTVNKRPLYALFGHLSRPSLQKLVVGQSVEKGEQFAAIGSRAVNGGWAPHLHFQLAWDDPGEANMPGVVTEQDRAEALQRYPDPRLVLGDLY